MLRRSLLSQQCSTQSTPTMTGRSTTDEFDLGNEDEKNKLQELKVIIVIGGDAEYIKKS